MENKEELPGPVILDVEPVSCTMTMTRSGDQKSLLPSSLVMSLRLAAGDEVRTHDNRDLTNVIWTMTFYQKGSGNELTKLHNSLGLINYYAEFHSKHDDIDDTPEACHAWANLDSEAFAVLRKMALAGKLPNGMRLHVIGMNYGWTPDGSVKEWDVKAYPNAPIAQIEINTSLVQAPETVHQENGAFLGMTKPDAPEHAALSAMTRAIEQANARLGWVVALLAVTAGAVILR